MSPLSRNTELRQSIERVIQAHIATGSNHLEGELTRVSISSTQRVSGGCISQAEIVTLEDGCKFFVKYNHTTPELFVAESEGLAEIELTKAIRVPQVIGNDQTDSGTGLLVLEVIETGQADTEFETRLGRSLANMHRRGRNDRFGYHCDNFIGRSLQINCWATSWVEFLIRDRLGYQSSLAQANGHTTTEFLKRFDRVISKLTSFIESDVEPCLIHGDLWSGNFMIASNGDPVLIDPAVYYGSREAEFGMTTLFSGLSPRFYDAYNECWPMSDGWQERVEIYRLYHLLNHLNLFGGVYFPACMQILKKFS